MPIRPNHWRLNFVVVPAEITLQEALDAVDEHLQEAAGQPGDVRREDLELIMQLDRTQWGSASVLALDQIAASAPVGAPLALLLLDVPGLVRETPTAGVNDMGIGEARDLRNQSATGVLILVDDDGEPVGLLDVDKHRGVEEIRWPELTVEPVYYATNRAPSGKTAPNRFFGHQRDDALNFGLAHVVIPVRHDRGELERPARWRLERENPREHVMILELETLARNDWVTRVKHDLAHIAGLAEGLRQVLVFIHGYNVTFAQAARRTAQLSNDLDFDGVTLLYSWPSRGKLGHYLVDANNIEWGHDDFLTVLRAALTDFDADVVHVIAHSMGNRTLANAVRRLHASPPDGAHAALRQVVFAAPDIDAGTFERLATAFWSPDTGFTLYASSADMALDASEILQGYPRAGDSGEGIVVVPGVESIDASAAKTRRGGHGYIMDSAPVLDDLQRMVKEQLNADDRGLEVVDAQDAAQRHWKIS